MPASRSSAHSSSLAPAPAITPRLRSGLVASATSLPRCKRCRHAPPATLRILRKQFERGAILWRPGAGRTDPILTGRKIALRAKFGTLGQFAAEPRCAPKRAPARGTRGPACSRDSINSRCCSPRGSCSLRSAQQCVATRPRPTLDRPSLLSNRRVGLKRNPAWQIDSRVHLARLRSSVSPRSRYHRCCLLKTTP
jgi:hypothetical protein